MWVQTIQGEIAVHRQMDQAHDDSSSDEELEGFVHGNKDGKRALTTILELKLTCLASIVIFMLRAFLTRCLSWRIFFPLSTNSQSTTSEIGCL